MNTTQQFEINGYAYLKNFLDKQNCQELVNVLRNQIEKNNVIFDEQCPLSYSVKNAIPTFDKLLEDLLPHFEKASGRKLLPTYAYCRMYQKGDNLKVHVDRPSCEISATLTLGFEGEQWPIYMSDDANGKYGNEIIMDVGDAVLYKGMQKYHWRNEFKGDWQAQIFLHYVDANGENANLIYDGRPCLESHKKTNEPFLYIENCFDEGACKRIIEKCESNNPLQAEIGFGDFATVDKSIRDVSRYEMPVNIGIGATLTGIGFNANANYFKFNIEKSNQCDFLRYDENGHYVSHIDTFIDPALYECRKLTILLFLNDDFEGGKLYLQLGDKKIYPPQSVGTVLIFPSFLLHGVEPVTSGIRRSVVTWLVGEWFK